jgi:hypothetical protein
MESDTPFEDIVDLILMASANMEKLAEAINRGPGGRELALAKTKLDEARHWMIDASMQVRVQTGKVNRGKVDIGRETQQRN